MKRLISACIDGATRLHNNEDGTTAVFTGLSLAVVTGFLVLGLQATVGVQSRARLQDAADNAAIGAMLALRAAPRSSPTLVAQGLLAENDVWGIEHLWTDIAFPPTQGPYAGVPDTIDITLSVPAPAGMGFIFGDKAGRISARATAMLREQGSACVLALGTEEDSLRMDRPADLRLDGCTTLSMEDGLNPTSLADADPWRDMPLPGMERCDALGLSVTADKNISPASGGVYGFCGDLHVGSGGRLSLGAGVYAILGNLTVEAGGSIEGDGVTLILLRNSSARLDPGAHVFLRAPLEGNTAGLVLAAGPLVEGASQLLGGKDQHLEGAVYLPGQQVHLAGSAPTQCLHVIGRTIHIAGLSRLANACGATAVRPIVAKFAQLAG